MTMKLTTIALAAVLAFGSTPALAQSGGAGQAAAEEAAELAGVAQVRVALPHLQPEPPAAMSTARAARPGRIPVTH
jgi:hypothetical protein